MNHPQSMRLSSDEIVRAVQAEIDRLPAEIREVLSLRPDSAQVTRTDEGDWVVPVTTAASGATDRSYELHRILSDIQSSVEKRLHAFVTILLAA